MSSTGVNLVPAPPALPAAAGSLLAAAHTPDVQELRQGTRYALDAVPVTGWDGWVGGCVPVVVSPAVEDAQPGQIVAAHPFTIQVMDSAPLFSRTPGELADRAAALCDAVTSAAVAREFWAAEIATTASWTVAAESNSWTGEPRLTGATDLNSAGALSVQKAIGVLEEWLRGHHGAGVGCIHATPAAVPSLADGAELRREGNLILTTLDTRVVADGGSPGTSPTGDDPASGEAWLYATARPVILRSPITSDTDPAALIDRAVNQATALAARTAVILLPYPDVAAVRVTL